MVSSPTPTIYRLATIHPLRTGRQTDGRQRVPKTPYSIAVARQNISKAPIDVRTLYCLPRSRDHVITAATIELHWLPIEARIQYKLCLLVHLAINSTGKAPIYISNLLQPVSALPDRSAVLRSATKSDLQVPRTRLKFGERAFSVAAPKAWNDLPTAPARHY